MLTKNPLFLSDQGSGAEVYNQARPVIAEMEAVNRVCLYALDTGCKVHICHVSSPKVAEIILNAKKLGICILSLKVLGSRTDGNL